MYNVYLEFLSVFIIVLLVLRVIGILMWLVINFVLVYDLDVSMIVDFYFDEKGKLLKDMDDFVWWEDIL